MKDLNEEYFQWMVDKMDGGSYTELLSYLHEREYQYTLPMDGNRYDDGIDLRYRFGRECGYNVVEISEELDRRPCSVLEMMIALSLRCEEHIMSDNSRGNRTGTWFWEMIESLGLLGCKNGRCNRTKVMSVIVKFLDHDYKKNGKGGLFTTKDPDFDMRTIEIWYQMHKHLKEITE